MNNQNTLWVFQKGVHIHNKIILQVRSFCEPTVIKIMTDDALIYTLDYDTYDKWNGWYALKAKEILQKFPTDKFEKVCVFDTDFYDELSKLDYP